MFININLASKGRSNFLLKIKTTAIRKKRQEKIHQADFRYLQERKMYRVNQMMHQKSKQ